MRIGQKEDSGRKVSGQPPEKGSMPGHWVLSPVRDGPALEFPVSLMPLEVLKERGSGVGVLEEPLAHFSP